MYSIGLDLGIASVGWSILDDQTGDIVDLGVRLFSSRSSADNEERRTARSTRRLLRRRRTRLHDAEKLLSQKGFTRDDADKHANPYALRVKGLTDKLTPSEINIVVKHILKKRGISYLEDAIDEGESSGYKEQIKENKALLENKTPGQIQYKRLIDGGRVRSGYNQKGEYQLNVFTVGEYAKELRLILEAQQPFYSELTDDFIAQFVDKKHGLVYRKRPYYQGPGNAANPSPYGIWADYPETKEPKTNIFEQLIGTDIKGLERASASSLSAQIYNLLNDLNNLRIPSQEDPKLTTEQKETILNTLLYDEVKTYGPKKLAKDLGYKVDDIKGWRLDTKEKPEIHTLKTYRSWKTLFAEAGIDITTISRENLDQIAKIITLNTDREAIEETLKIESLPVSDEVIAFILDNYAALKKKASTSSWHAFSTEVLSTLIPELLHSNDEQNTILERLGLKVDFRTKFADYKHLPIQTITEEILNPTVNKTVSQALKVFNALVDRLGKENISNVVIEMPRDDNEKEKKRRIDKMQKDFKKKKDAAAKYFKEKANWSDAKLETNLVKKSFAQKLQYYYEQDGKCAYSGEPINPEDLLTNYVEIDHIIPLAISLDDSINNKVLVKQKMNQAKGRRSPYQAFMEGVMPTNTWDQYVAWVNANPRYKKSKRRLLLDNRNIYDPEVVKGFKQRNLNDTRYSSRIVLNALQSFFAHNEINDKHTKTKVRVINGAYTHTLRKKWGDFLEKNRETHHHHAVDATLCAVSPFVKTTPYQYVETESGKYMVNPETGESIPYNEYKKDNKRNYRSYKPKFNDFEKQLIPREINPRIKFSHQVDKKVNRKVSDATIYSTRTVTETEVKRGKEIANQETYVIGKIKDIYTVDGWEAFHKKQDKLLMKDHDEQTYQKLMTIAETYKDVKEVQTDNGKYKKIKVSPFKRYCEENNVPGVQKYSKKGNGPLIKSVKFYDKKIGSHINITKDENGKLIDKTSNNKKVILQQLTLWRTDVYYDEIKDQYHLMGIRYNHLKFMNNGLYGIPEKEYNNIKESEQIPKHATFVFSLYIKDFVKIKDQSGNSISGLFFGRSGSFKNYFIMKPEERPKYNKKENVPIFGNATSSGILFKGLSQGLKLEKYSTDYLGNHHRIKKEELKNIID